MYPVSVLKHKGFSLIELMLVVAIVAIIASVALPSYFDSVERSRRAEGKALLLDVASRQERFYTLNSRYQSAVELAGPPVPTSENNWYTVVSNAGNNATTYVLSAVPIPAWNQTLVCGNLTLSNTGVRSALGDADGDGNQNTLANLTLDQDDIDLCWR